MCCPQAILATLAGVRKTSHGWAAKCPCHDDGRASLSVWIGSKGDLCAKCFGCGARWRDVQQATRTAMADWFAEPLEPRRKRTVSRVITATYDYYDADGELVYQVCRFDPKGFAQRRPASNGGWTWDLAGVQPTLYRLPELIMRPEAPVVVVEGEKDADAVAALGLLATCNSGGAGKWPWDCGQHLAGRRVVVIPDDDEPGWRHAGQVVACAVTHGAESVRLVRLPHGKDVSDFLTKWPSPQDRKYALVGAIKASPEWRLTSERRSWAPWRPTKCSPGGLSPTRPSAATTG